MQFITPHQRIASGILLTILLPQFAHSEIVLLERFKTWRKRFYNAFNESKSTTIFNVEELILYLYDGQLEQEEEEKTFRQYCDSLPGNIL